MKSKLTKFHFIILLILVVNFIITNTFDIGLNSYIKMLIALLLFGSGFSLFALNFKRLFKPFTFLKVYTTLYITIPIFALFIWTNNEHWSISVSSDVEEVFLQDVPTYRQYNYEIYERPRILAFLECNNGSPYRRLSNNYYIDKNYFIFKTRIGYFHSVHKNRENTNFEIPMYLIKEEIKSIDIKNDSIYIDFKNDLNRVFEIEK